MTAATTIAADLKVIADAQASLDAGAVKLAADRADAANAAAKAAPHLAVLQEIESAVAKYGAEAQAEIGGIVARARALFDL